MAERANRERLPAVPVVAHGFLVVCNKSGAACVQDRVDAVLDALLGFLLTERKMLEQLTARLHTSQRGVALIAQLPLLGSNVELLRLVAKKLFNVVFLFLPFLKTRYHSSVIIRALSSILFLAFHGLFREAHNVVHAGFKRRPKLTSLLQCSSPKAPARRRQQCPKAAKSLCAVRSTSATASRTSMAQGPPSSAPAQPSSRSH